MKRLKRMFLPVIVSILMLAAVTPTAMADFVDINGNSISCPNGYVWVGLYCTWVPYPGPYGSDGQYYCFDAYTCA